MWVSTHVFWGLHHLHTFLTWAFGSNILQLHVFPLTKEMSLWVLWVLAEIHTSLVGSRWIRSVCLTAFWQLSIYFKANKMSATIRQHLATIWPFHPWGPTSPPEEMVLEIGEAFECRTPYPSHPGMVATEWADCHPQKDTGNEIKCDPRGQASQTAVTKGCSPSVYGSVVTGESDL